MKNVDILILNYNGEHLLRRFLPSIVKSVQYSKNRCKLFILDNCSSDGSQEFISANYPSVSFIKSRKNDVLCSYNPVIDKLQSDIIVLLNNDIEAKEDFIDYLIGHFDVDNNVFFAAPRVLNPDNTFNGGRSYLYQKFGILTNIVDSKHAAEQGFTHSIACGAFRRDLFSKLGGFDTIYLPGIWEEVDLCYRALLNGKKGVYEPRSVIWHQESSTFNREFGKSRKMVLAHRNMFLFFWKNISDLPMFLRHILCLPFRLVHSLFYGRGELAAGFFLALVRLPVVFSRRLSLSRSPVSRVLKDRDIISPYKTG